MKIIAEVKVMGNTALVQGPVPLNLIDGLYRVDIAPIRETRSQRQNRYMWKLINEISKTQSGDLSDVQNIYLHCLRKCGAKYEVLLLKHEALETFKKHWKDCSIIKQEERNGTVYDTVIAFHGSSTFDKKEMSDLIDCVLNYAYECGVGDIDGYWKEILND